jgi:hypothetical protein
LTWNNEAMVRDVSLSPDSIPQPSSESKFVYHYTNSVGLLGIIENRCLWATDVRFMNDLREALYSREAISRMLEAPRGGTPLEDRVLTEVDAMMTGLQSTTLVPFRSYIACLSEADDLLSQWRAYGYSRGFSIGFDRERLRALSAQPGLPVKFTLRNVSYDLDLLDRMIRDGLGVLLNQLQQLPATPSDPEIIAAALSLVVAIHNVASAFKDSAFEEEKEVRLHGFGSADSATDKLSFRDSSAGLTPYIKIPLSSDDKEPITAIREIVVGPQGNQEATISAVTLLLDRHQITNVGVRPSKIPLRGSGT